MSAISAPPLNQSRDGNAPSADPSRRWILNSWLDQLFIVSTPLLVIPAIFALYSPLRVKAETISLVVTAFFALGHHLPGLIRAYGDRELFHRFRWRFVLAPPLLFAAYFPLYFYHLDAWKLIIIFWATWHGLMQVYGFVRIYDAKVGSTAPKTAYWDWLVCLCGFVTALVFSPARMSNLLGHWYAFGGPLISPAAVETSRWACLAISIVVLTGFAANYVAQSHRGAGPNPIKLLLLASGIGTWWIAVVWVENVILGVALFEICHDIQYLAIVWLYNRRRVSANPELGRFMSYVFRRGMVLLYLGLIVAYGAIGLLPALVQDGTVAAFFSAILGTSTILHYYYDGFIWKVREKSTQAGLGLNECAAARQRGAPAARPDACGFAPFRVPHLLKWSPLIVVVGWLFATDLLEKPSLTQARKDEIEKRYVQSLIGNTMLPSGAQEQSWLYMLFEREQNVADCVPRDRSAQLRAAIMLANFGRNDEAVDRLEKLLREHPAFSDGYTTLGGIHLYRGDFDGASACFQAALSQATTEIERSAANLKLGEMYLHRNDRELAEARFGEALRENPKLQPSIDALRRDVDTARSIGQ
jgi:tetratricopeptide (TPR) repeat protein